MARRTHEFQTIHSEGGLLPPDLLRRVLDPKEKLEGTTPTDYGLPPGERLNEVITQSWNRLRKHWADFRAAAKGLPEDEAGTGLTNDKWSVPLLRELGFGMLPTSTAPEINGKTYAINRFFGATAVHLIGCQLDLDRRAKGVRGAAIANPHGLVQDFLNRSDKHLWAILSNGLRLRVLRDSQAISRQSYLEFDLEAMFEGEVFADFVLLWLMAHSTRFAARESDRSETCWLEQWTKEAEEQGTRALGDLRQGVEKALEVLGQGFVGHPKNIALRDALRTGQLTLSEFHGQLLRVVYRLIFLFVAEDRTLDGLPLLHVTDDSEVARIARERYAAHYSAGRLRDMAGSIRGSRHGDLWWQFNLVVGALSGDKRFKAVRQQLALPALGSFLWSPDSTAALNAPCLAESDGTTLANADWLESIRHLAFTRQNRSLRPVDYKNLGAEELGGVYESLLALTPQISSDGAKFTFAEFAGNERKTSGSYYTPDSLVQCLLDSALEPVIEEAVRGKSGAEAEQAILALKVCDPAVGSGHFLVGAAHRLARHLARIRAVVEGEGEPSPKFYQHALRDVIGRCLYGVDINPMAAELCRVSLWLEALDPGKPLSFLDHHIRVGNSLLGATPKRIESGLPDDAFTAIEGDDKQVCTQLKKRNKAEREGFDQQDWIGGGAGHGVTADLSVVTREASNLDATADDTVDAVQRKADQFRRLVVSPEYTHAQQVADAWCAAFVWPKTPTTVDEVVTTGVIRRLANDPKALSAAQTREVERLSGQFQFLHWHLAFPEVFAKDGFDCVLGNPPWEKLQTEELQFFAVRAPEIARLPGSRRKLAIKALRDSHPALAKEWSLQKRIDASSIAFVRHSGTYPLTGVGKFNTFALFTELGKRLLSQRGRLGCIVPSGLATDDTTKLFFQDVISTRSLISLFDFENRLALFPDIDSRMKFCLLTLSGQHQEGVTDAEFVFFAHAIANLRDEAKRFTLSQDDIVLLNPNTRTCATFRSRGDAVLTKHIYRAIPVFLFESSPEKSPYAPQVWRLLNTTDDSADFVDPLEVPQAKRVPVVEAKTIHQFDHRYATFLASGGADEEASEIPDAAKQMPTVVSQARYYVTDELFRQRMPPQLSDKGWFLTARNITNATNERTVIATIIPRAASCEVTPYIETAGGAKAAAFLTGLFNSYALDYVARQKVGGTHLSYFILYQLPVLFPGPELLHQLGFVVPRVLELIYTAWDLLPFANDCGFDGPPFRWNEGRRALLRAELDAAFFHMYLPADANGDWVKADSETEEDLNRLRASFRKPRNAVEYIMDTFPIVRRKDEEKWGTYKTKEMLLLIYDEIQEAVRTGKEYQTKMSPPPSDPRCCHPALPANAQ